MGNVAHVLSPGMVDALAIHFKYLDPPPYGGAPRDLMSEGEKIYHEGVPSAEVPACESCHGQDAHGMDEFPRLAGQLDGYVIAKLANWPKERGQDRRIRTIRDHGPDRREADQRADRRGRRLCQRPQVILRSSGSFYDRAPTDRFRPIDHSTTASQFARCPPEPPGGRRSRGGLPRANAAASLCYYHLTSTVHCDGPVDFVVKVYGLPASDAALPVAKLPLAL